MKISFSAYDITTVCLTLLFPHCEGITAYTKHVHLYVLCLGTCHSIAQSQGEVEDTGSTAAEGSLLLRPVISGKAGRGGGEGERSAEDDHCHHDPLGTAAYSLSLPHPADIHPSLSSV